MVTIPHKPSAVLGIRPFLFRPKPRNSSMKKSIQQIKRKKTEIKTASVIFVLSETSLLIFVKFVWSDIITLLFWRTFNHDSAMKKAAFIICFAFFSSLVAAAGTETVVNTGDPKKEQKKESSSNLAQGYFNLFSILFTATPPPTDTTKVKSSDPVLPATTGDKK